MRSVIFFIFLFTSNICLCLEDKKFKKKLSVLKKQTVVIHNDILKNDDELRKIKIDIEKNSQKKQFLKNILRTKK